MPILAICHNIPLCSSNESPLAKAVRITFIALGVIALTLGILALLKVGALQNLGPLGGGLCIGGALLDLLIATCASCKERQNQTRQSNHATPETTPISHNPSTKSTAIVDPTANYRFTSSSTSFDSKTNSTYKTLDKYCPFQDVLKLTSMEYEKLRQTLRQDLQIADLEARLKENFRTTDIQVVIPFTYQSYGPSENYQLEETKTLTALKLLFLTAQEIAALPKEEIEQYDEDMQDLLALRLIKAPIQLAALVDPIPSRLYRFMGPAEMLPLLSAEHISHFFPQTRPFFLNQLICMHLDSLPLEQKQKWLPFLGATALWHLISKESKNLDFSILQKKQVEELFPIEWHGPDKVALERLKALPIEIVNQIVDKMSATQLKNLPQKHLENSKLNLTKLTPDQVHGIFPMGRFEIQSDESRKRLALLKTPILNQLITKMTYEQRLALPNKHLKSSELDLRGLSRDQVRAMFVAEGTFDFDADKKSANLKALHPSVRQQIAQHLS